MEDRVVLANFVVTALGEAENPADNATVFTLPEAIKAANNPMIAGPHTITFAAALDGQTIALTKELPMLIGNITIDGHFQRHAQQDWHFSRERSYGKLSVLDCRCDLIFKPQRS